MHSSCQAARGVALEAVLGLDASKACERRPNRRQAAGIGSTLPACSQPHQNRHRGGGGALLSTVQKCERSRRDPGCRVRSGLAQSTGRSRSASTSPLPPSTFPPSPPRPSSATACRKEEAVAGVAGALPSSVAGKQHSTAPQLHSCTAAPACRNILAGKTCLCPLTLTAKRSSSFPSSASLTLYSSFPSRSPNPFPTRLRPSPSQLQHSHPFHRVEQAARSSSTPIWTFFPNTLSAVTRALDAHRRGPHSRGENGRAFGSLLRLSGL